MNCEQQWKFKYSSPARLLARLIDGGVHDRYNSASELAEHPYPIILHAFRLHMNIKTLQLLLVICSIWSQIVCICLVVVGYFMAVSISYTVYSLVVSLSTATQLSLILTTPLNHFGDIFDDIFLSYIYLRTSWVTISPNSWL